MISFALTIMLTVPLSALLAATPAAAHLADAVYVAPTGYANIGGRYSDTDTTASSVETDITIPTMAPHGTDSYYAMMSIFDSSLHFDQLGFGATNGNWYLAWSALGDCGTSTSSSEFSVGVRLLIVGLTYHFKMETTGSGNVRFTLSENGVELWRLNENTGANNFRVEDLTSCAIGQGFPGDYDGYTVGEFIYIVHDEANPYWGFDFKANKAGGQIQDDWDRYAVTEGQADLPDTTNEPGAGAIIGTGAGHWGDVYIWNEWFRVKVTSGATVLDIQQTTTSFYSASFFTLEIGEDDFWSLNCGSTCPVDLSIVNPPSGWTVTISPTSATPETAVTLDMDIPYAAALGDYPLVLWAQRSSGYFTTVQVWVRITAPPGGGGGGSEGCVDQDMWISTNTGTTKAKDLTGNEILVGYDPEHDETGELQQTATSTLEERYGVSINQGALELPGHDTRIWGHIAGEENPGWIDDAENLHPGDLIYDAANDRWVEISSAVPIDQINYVCGIATEDYNTYLANGWVVGGHHL